MSFSNFILQIFGCSLEGNLLCVDILRKRLKSIIVHKSLEKLSTILLCGIVHWSADSSLPSSWPVWQCITYADFSNNSLTKIDPSIVRIIFLLILKINLLALGTLFMYLFFCFSEITNICYSS